MAEFLIEIYSEEIPAKMQSRAAANFKQIFSEFFYKILILLIILHILACSYYGISKIDSSDSINEKF